MLSIADAHITMTDERRNLTGKTREAYAIPVNECTQQIYPGELGRHELPCCSDYRNGACRAPVHHFKACQEVLVCSHVRTRAVIALLLLL